MKIWQKEVSLALLNGSHGKTAVGRLGIEFIEVGDDFIRARAPVDERTSLGGMLHSGVAVVLAETLGSCGAHYAVSADRQAVGLSINANHFKRPSAGWITGVTRALKNEEDAQVWAIEIRDDDDDLVSTSQIVMAVLRPRLPAGSTASGVRQ
jgi:uncharacterized protein (TIGR00369 family)